MNPVLFLSIFFGYLIVINLLGVAFSRNNRNGADFLLGGRSLPFLLTLGTIVATMVGTGSSMGAVGKAYDNGWMASLFFVGGSIGLVLVGLLFAPVRRYEFMTLAEELSFYVGANRTVNNMTAVLTWLASVGWLGAHIIGGGRYLQFVTGIPPEWAMLLVALGFGIYSTIGGYRAVVWTDSIQAIVVFVGFVATATVAYHSIGGWEGLNQTHRELQAAKPEEGKLLPGLSLIVAIAVSVLATPSVRQRIYSGKTVSHIRKAFIFSGVLFLGFAILPSIIGMAAYRASPNLSNSDLAFPEMATKLLPLWLGIITLLAGLSASMSTASSDAIAGVTTIVRDLYFMVFRKMPQGNRVIFISRIAMGLTTVFALGMALTADSIMSYIKDMVALFISGLCVCGILGSQWKRYNAPGAISSLLGAFVTALAFRFNTDWTQFLGGAIIPALIVSITLGVLVSLLTRPDPRTPEEALAILEEQRNQMN